MSACPLAEEELSGCVKPEVKESVCQPAVYRCPAAKNDSLALAFTYLARQTEPKPCCQGENCIPASTHTNFHYHLNVIIHDTFWKVVDLNCYYTVLCTSY